MFGAGLVSNLRRTGGDDVQLTPDMSAWVSGAGSGIGQALSMELAARGMRVAVADIRKDAAEETVELIRRANGKAVAVAVDVSDSGAFEDGARSAEAQIGPISLVCNNAGIAMHGVPLHQIALADWDWTIGVNVYGVIHGIRAFVPGMLDRGDPGHIVNTASIGGFQVNPNFLTAAYSMTKYAVVALSEGLRNELSGTQIGVSVLAPAAVATGIHLSARSRPERLGGAGERPENLFLGELIKDGATPREIGRAVLDAVEEDRFYIFTHPDTEEWLTRRHKEIHDAFAQARARGAAT
jgi:NAD(P)-dependent dehydrogenase (short-subunit alcohol dehydrogenase family)